MPKRMLLVLGIVGLLAALAIPVIAQADHPAITRDATRVATLAGSGVTDPVDSDGAGLARVTIDVRKRLICYDLIVSGVIPTAIHIHPGAAGTDGAPLLALSFGEPVGSSSHGCVQGAGAPKRPVLRDIKKNPDQYYVQVHTAANPGGELRGQLSR